MSSAPTISDTARWPAELAEQLTVWRRHLHAQPEVAFAEHDTTAYIADQLELLSHRFRSSLSLRRNINQTGVLAELCVPGARRTLALRADIDALPIADGKSVPYRSARPGAAHLCGHDAHTAMALGAVALLMAQRSRLRVNVRVIFQPAEEKLPGGARGIVEAGLVDGVAEILALHVYSGLPTGTVGLRVGPLLASADEFTVLFRGRGGHAAAPHQTADPITAAADFVTAVQSVVSRSVDPLQPAVISVCRWDAGTADNVVPDTAQLAGTIRALDEAVRERLHQRVREVADGVAAAHGLLAESAILRGYPVTVNHAETVARVRQILDRLNPGGDADSDPSRAVRCVEVAPKCGGEDFAYYLQRVPGAMIWLGTGNPACGSHHSHHHPLFDVDESALPLGAVLLAEFCLSAAS